MSRYQRSALNHFLSDYPRDWGYNRVLNAIEKEKDCVIIWEPFEHYPPEQVVEFIADMVTALKSEFPKKEKAKS